MAWAPACASAFPPPAPQTAELLFGAPARDIAAPRRRKRLPRPATSRGLHDAPIPVAGSTPSPDDYYATLFHELAHATGAKHRLDRELGRAGSDAYSREELVAEMASAFLCARYGIDGPALPNQTAYLAGWIKTLKGDPHLVIRAARQAQRAARLILGKPTPEPA